MRKCFFHSFHDRLQPYICIVLSLSLGVRFRFQFARVFHAVFFNFLLVFTHFFYSFRGPFSYCYRVWAIFLFSWIIQKHYSSWVLNKNALKSRCRENTWKKNIIHSHSKHIECKKQNLITSLEGNDRKKKNHTRKMPHTVYLCKVENERAKKRLYEDENLFFYSFILIIERSICDMWRMYSTQHTHIPHHTNIYAHTHTRTHTLPLNASSLLLSLPANVLSVSEYS